MTEAEPALARAYYESLDKGAYDRLADVLAPTFVHCRPDRTIKGRDSFVRFMREERPDPNTEHVVEQVYTRGDGVAVRGKLLREDGSRWFSFIDVFEFDGNRVATLKTFAD